MMGMSFSAYGAVLRRVATADAIERDRVDIAEGWDRRPRIGSQLPGRCPSGASTVTLIVAEPPMAMTLLGA